MNKKYVFVAAVLSTCSVYSINSWAQQQPDAGRTIQQLQEAPSLPQTQTAVPAMQQQPEAEQTGGPTVTIQSVVLENNTIYSDEELMSVIGDVIGGSYDLAGLKKIAEKITNFYHENDYPFAKAVVPAQAIKDGEFKIKVVEGRYGKISIRSNEKYKETATKFLYRLQEGAVIEGAPLERTSLILDNQPGYKFVPVVHPGKNVMTGDLTFTMKEDDKLGGSIGLDNHGNRYTGKRRASANGYANSTWLFGDQLTGSMLYSEEGMWSGSAYYGVPVGYSGLRAKVGYSHTYYELGGSFKSLDAHGTADILSAGLTYPLVQSVKTNVTLGATYQHKWLSDEQDVAATEDEKNMHSLPLMLSFDRRDNLIGGGVSWGYFSLTNGMLDLDGSLTSTDKSTAKSDGYFSKLNLDISRLQATKVKGLTVYARLAGQKAFNNLDSSEDFGLGGASGVRAYPSGESYGDEGALAQIELRYKANEYIEPFLFYDVGFSKTNYNPWTSADNERIISGAGLGGRASYESITADASVAWRTRGGHPESDTAARLPYFWFNLGYKF